MFFCGFFAVKNTETAEAHTSSTITSATKIGGGVDLWDSSKQAFNRNVADDLLAKLFGETQSDGSIKIIEPYDYITNVQNYDPDEKNTYSTRSTVVNAKTINKKVGNETYGAVVKLGGLDWIIASMTLGGYDSKTETEGDVPVLTLYLAETLTNASGTALKSNWLNVAPSEAGANMYASSLIRNNIAFLSGNSGSDYSKIAMFNNSSEWAKKYLVQPKDIKYQHLETHLDRGWRGYFYLNEGLDAEKFTTSFKSNGYTGAWYSCFGTTFTNSNFEYDGTKNNGGGRIAKYTEWGSDYIWLPCATETGWTSSPLSTKSIWKLTSQQNSAKETSYLRSSNYDSIAGKTWLSTSGGYDCDTSGVRACGVRPAIHLNLESILSLVEPEETTKIYNGESQDLKDQSWYRIDIFDNEELCTVMYTNEKDNECVPKEAGTYTATFELLTDDYVWAGDETDKIRKAKFTIAPKELEVSFTMGEDGYPKPAFKPNKAPCEGETVDIALTYADESGKTLTSPPVHRGNYTATASISDKNYKLTGKTTYNFELLARRVDVPKWFDDKDSATYATVASGRYQFELDLDPTLFKLSVPTQFQKDLSEGGILLDSDNVITVTQAGEYEITVSIIDDTGDTLWRDRDDHAPRNIKFTLNPALYSLDFASNNTIAVGIEQNTTVTIYASAPLEGDEISVTLKSRRGNSTRTLATGIKFNSDNLTGVYTVELETQKLAEGEYTLDVEWDNTNYKVVLPADGVSLVVSAIATSASVTWDLRNSTTQIARQTATNATAAFTQKIPYDGKVYYVNATPNLGFTIDRTKNTDGFKNGIKTVNADGEAAQGKNAGVYTTTVCLRATATGETYEYSVTFEIEKAKLDLGNVKWQNGGKMPYNGLSQTCELEGLPEGITANYAGALSGKEVKKVGQITVSFTLSKEAAQNYYQPLQSDTNSYKGDFSWSVDWEIIPLTIPLNWKIEGLRDENGALYNGYVLENGGEFVKYYYYETDASGNIAEGTEPLEAIVVPKDKIKYYKAKATIAENFAQNYALAEEEANCYSNFFEVGRVIEEVQVGASKTEYTYWGSPVAFQFRVTKGAVKTSCFDITYWNGYTQLSGAPTNVGSYRAQISIKREYRNSYSLQGATSFNFTIGRAVITPQWNTSAKPPMLTLNTAEAKAITYEYVDENNNPISFSSLQRGNDYAVRAVISDTTNYVFADGKSATEWQHFSIAANETPVDPTDPSNPFHPSENPTDPNDPGGENPTEKIPVAVSLMNATTNYNGVTQAARFTNTAGLPESAFVVTYNGQMTPPTTAGTYQVEVRLADAYASAYELTGSTSFVYTILGANGDGGNTGTPDGGADGGNASDATFVSYLPIILSGVSLVLIVVFGVMILNCNSAAKAAKAKTRKLSQITYSFAPLSFLAIVLGLSETNWWIVAGVLMGVALIMGIVAVMFRNKKQKALLMLEEEEARVADEKAYAEKEQAREEQARRDNEMRMMFAAMQQNSQQSLNYEAIQGMISSTVSALLPAMQQQMALPPAPSEAAPSAAQAEIDRLNAQMAQQQEMMNQLMQERQNVVYAQPYEEEPVDDISWLGQSDELVSLEESYGNLSDEEKRCYYEIGSYIMNKPRTSQNDGRYAVLFKYRRKTLFKLCILGDAPVLYYPAENGGRGEIRILESTLDLAKSVIDRCTLKVDNELN